MTCDRKKAKYHHSRRQFLNLMGAGSVVALSSDPLSLLVRSMVDGLIAKAQAQEGGTAPRNYVVALSYGAPPRWMFDNFLNPAGQSSQFIANLGMNNYFKNDTFTANGSPHDLEYRDTLIDLGGGNSIYLPVLWGATIPTVGGNEVAMASILNNIMLVRGCDMEVDIGHGDGPALTTRVSEGSPSSTGLVADASVRPIPAVALTEAAIRGGYKSSKGTSQVYLQPDYTGVVSNAISKIIDPFTITDPAVVNAAPNRAQMKALVDAAMDALGSYAKSSKFGANALYNDRHNAEILFQQNLQPLVEQYNQAVTKYRQLAIDCAKYVPGIIPAGHGLPAWSQSVSVTTSGAEGFAAAEVLLKNSLSSTVTFSIGSAGWSAYGYFNYHDEHTGADRHVGVLPHNHEFRCIAAWLYEFRRALGNDLFNETLLHISAEYGRKARHVETNGGSDHASDATSLTLFSGAIKHPTFLGNIQIGATTGDYRGTYGKAAPVLTNDGTRIITKKNVGNGICDILRVARMTSDNPAFTLENDQVVSLCESPKNIA